MSKVRLDIEMVKRGLSQSRERARAGGLYHAALRRVEVARAPLAVRRRLHAPLPRPAPRS